jgi:hypothetical protein
MTIGIRTRYNAEQIRRLREHTSSSQDVVAHYEDDGREVVSNYEPRFHLIALGLGVGKNMILSGFSNLAEMTKIRDLLEKRVGFAVSSQMQYSGRQYLYNARGNKLNIQRTA